MIDVYVLEVGEYDQSVTVGVFSTLELAKAAAVDQNTYGRTGRWCHSARTPDQEWWTDGDATITRYRLDEVS